MKKRNETDPGWIYKNLKGVLVYALDNQTNEFTEFVSFKKLEQLRNTSPNQKEGELSGVWKQWSEEMYKAKAIKYVATRLPINDSLAEALLLDDRQYKLPEQPKEPDYILTEKEKEELAKITLEDTSEDLNEVLKNQSKE